MPAWAAASEPGGIRRRHEAEEEEEEEEVMRMTRAYAGLSLCAKGEQVRLRLAGRGGPPGWRLSPCLPPEQQPQPQRAALRGEQHGRPSSRRPFRARFPTFSRCSLRCARRAVGPRAGRPPLPLPQARLAAEGVSGGARADLGHELAGQQPGGRGGGGARVARRRGGGGAQQLDRRGPHAPSRPGSGAAPTQAAAATLPCPALRGVRRALRPPPLSCASCPSWSSCASASGAPWPLPARESPSIGGRAAAAPPTRQQQQQQM